MKPVAWTAGFKKELAAGVAATLFLYLAVLTIPIAGFMGGLFTPLPTLVFLYRWGSPSGYALPVVASAVALVGLWSLGLTGVIVPMLGLMILGALLADGMRREWSLEKTIAGAAVVAFASGWVILWTVHGGGEGGIFKALESDLVGAIEHAIGVYGPESAERRLLEEGFKMAVPTVVRLLPGAGISSALVLCWLNLLIFSRFWRALGHAAPPWGEWSQWKAPERLVWGVIGAGVLLILPLDRVFTLAALNVMMILGTIYLFQGLSICAYYFQRWRLPLFFRGILYGIFFLQQFATLGVMLLGLFDLWFDFRRLSRKPVVDA